MKCEKANDGRTTCQARKTESEKQEAVFKGKPIGKQKEQDEKIKGEHWKVAESAARLATLDTFAALELSAHFIAVGVKKCMLRERRSERVPSISRQAQRIKFVD